MKYIFIFCLFFFFKDLHANSKNKNSDTCFFYSIILIEKETLSKDAINSVFIGDFFDDFFITNFNTDTIHVKYNFPFLILDRNTLIKLKNLSGKNSELFLYMKSKKNGFVIKMPFNIIFEHYVVTLLRKKLKSEIYECSISSVINNMNISNVSFCIAQKIKLKNP